MKLKVALPNIPPIIYFLGMWGVIGLSLYVPNWSQQQHATIAGHRSLGQLSFSQANASEAERQGIKAFANGNYDVAAAHFIDASKASPSDPIPLIYAENARWLKQQPLHVAAMAG